MLFQLSKHTVKNPAANSLRRQARQGHGLRAQRNSAPKITVINRASAIPLSPSQPGFFTVVLVRRKSTPFASLNRRRILVQNV
jgi:hypothetical protein